VGDPFFARVRRRHPDLDLVLLPPETTETPETVETVEAGRPAPVDPGAEEALADDLASVEEAARRLGLDEQAVIARGTQPGTVCARVRGVRDEPVDGSRIVEVTGPDRAVGAARVRSLVGGR
jgi:hypothetical protein